MTVSPKLRRVGVAVIAALGLGGAGVGIKLAIESSNGPSKHAVVVKSKHSQISVAYNSFIIGNAYPGWTEYVQGGDVHNGGPGNPKGGTYRLGFIIGPSFQACGWLQSYNWVRTGKTTTARCNGPHWTRGLGDPNFLSWFRGNFTNGDISHGAGDASPTVYNSANPGCGTTTGYGNVEPWKRHEVGSQPVPIKTRNGITNEMGWRYVARDPRFVMVHDHNPTPGQPNWYFVKRGCLSHTLTG